MLNEKSILISGGTGSFGRKCTEMILQRYEPRKLIIFSRDELKQYEMAQDFSPDKHDCLRYFIGDVRDQVRLIAAFRDVDFVIHAAALKHIPATEYNPFEAIKTNVLGAQNVIRAAINKKVKKVVALSTDKAANPINLYGASKLCSDKLFIAGNAMSGHKGTIFSIVRYGNVFGSRGSVVPLFLKKRSEGRLPITDTRMTRFSITLEESVNFVLEGFKRMLGGEIFVPKIPSYKIVDVAEAIAPEGEIEVVGIRSGEKMHEVLVPEDEARQTIEFEDHFVIQPDQGWWRDLRAIDYAERTGGKPCPMGFSYSSERNTQWLSVEQITKLVEQYCLENKVG